MKVRQVIRILEQHGFRLVRQRGSHRLFEGMVGGRRKIIPVPGKDGDDVRMGTLSAIANQSGLSGRLFRQV